MEKDFSKWNELKPAIEARHRILFSEREVWWCAVGANIGFEQDGKGNFFERPVLIFKNFGNGAFWGIPTTTRAGTGRFYAPIYFGNPTPNVAVLSQLRLFDAKRLINKAGVITPENYEEIQKAVIALCQ